MVAALLQPCLCLPVLVEETHHIGEKLALGIKPLGEGLEIKPADAELADPVRGLGIQIGGELHPALVIPHGSGEIGGRQGHQLGELLGHVEGAALGARVIPGEVEVARVSPEGVVLLINGHEFALTVNDLAPLADRPDLLGLYGPGPGLQHVALLDLQPGQPEPKTSQSSDQ